MKQVPREFRKWGFYVLADEYAQVVSSRLYGPRLNMGNHPSVERDVHVGQRASTSNLNLEQVHVEQRTSNFEMVQENLKDDKLSADGKMDKLINLCKFILLSNVVLAVVISLGLVILLIKWCNLGAHVPACCNEVHGLLKKIGQHVAACAMKLWNMQQLLHSQSNHWFATTSIKSSIIMQELYVALFASLFNCINKTDKIHDGWLWHFL